VGFGGFENNEKKAINSEYLRSIGVFQKLGVNALHIRSKGELADGGEGVKFVLL
jgi:hypothetical protein